jgi:hypothetical protein
MRCLPHTLQHLGMSCALLSCAVPPAAAAAAAAPPSPPGDHALTGLAIGKMLGIAGNGSVVTGPELDEMTDEQLRLVVSVC